MASSNRHWPSLFKSKPSCASANHQWQQDIDHLPHLHGHCHKPNSYASGAEERTPEPKPRWNPKPEQIRILEAIFNSGMVNPPREEIRRIRNQLQVYGQVGDANVFYWFQNRKSRSKHKNRQIKSASSAAPTASASASQAPATVSVVSPPATTSTSSSSGSDKMQSAPPASTAAAVLAALFDLPPSPVQTANQTFQPSFLRPELSLEAPFLMPASYPLSSSELTGQPFLGGDHDLSVFGAYEKNSGREVEVEAVGFNKLGMVGLLDCVGDSATSSPAAKPAINGSPSPVSEIQVIWSVVFINDVAYEVMAGPLNIREAFGPEAVLLQSSGHPVLTDDWGITLQPLQHGASYYLV